MQTQVTSVPAPFDHTPELPTGIQNPNILVLPISVGYYVSGGVVRLLWERTWHVFNNGDVSFHRIPATHILIRVDVYTEFPASPTKSFPARLCPLDKYSAPLPFVGRSAFVRYARPGRSKQIKAVTPPVVMMNGELDGQPRPMFSVPPAVNREGHVGPGTFWRANGISSSCVMDIARSAERRFGIIYALLFLVILSPIRTIFLQQSKRDRNGDLQQKYRSKYLQPTSTIHKHLSPCPLRMISASIASPRFFNYTEVSIENGL